MRTDGGRGGGRSSVHHGKSPASLGLQKHNYGVFQTKPEPVKKESFKPTL